MSSLIGALSSWILHYYAWKYVIISLGILIQGEITVLVSLYLIVHHRLDWMGFIFAFLNAVIIYELFFYFLGKFLRGTPAGAWLQKRIPNHRTVQWYIHENAIKFLIASRFIAYANVTMLFLSGWTEMSFKKFLRVRAIANGLWFFGNATLAYFLVQGTTLIHGESIVKQIELGVLLAIVFIGGSKWLFTKLFKKEAILEEKAARVGTFIENIEK